MTNTAWFKAMVVLALIGFATIFGCGSKGNSSSQVVPQGAWKTQQIITNRYLPTNFTAIMGTAQAATLTKTQSGVPAKIEVDYMRLIEDDPTSGLTVLADNHYDIAVPLGLPSTQGALYDRSPVWYGYTDNHVPMTNSYIQTGL
jgi:hypothetical protein